MFCSSNNSSVFSSNLTRIDGWVDQPNTRGTLDIIWTSVFTIFICTFTLLCLNLPAENDTPWKVTARKLFWMGLAIAGPEFVLTAACGQLGTAQESVKAFLELGHPQWTIRHGFFADMGGFLFVPRESTPFPITSKHLHWLVSRRYLAFPDIPPKEIWDKSKQDTVAKLISCFQIGYLMVQCFGRVGQRLAITTLELSALAIVVCSIMTNICWLRKPAGVLTPIRIYSELSMEEILKDAGAADLPWKQTPLDFVDDLGPSWALNVQSFINMPVGPHERPMPRFGNDRLPNLNGRYETLLCFATLVYAAIHLAGWNFVFPTRAERILWRASSVFIFGNTAVFWICETAAAWHRKGRWQRFFYRIFDPGRMEEVELARQAKLARQEPKQLPLAWEFWTITPLAITYAAARGYQIIEAFMGLRSLEPSAYLNVEWSSYIPHI
jgi:hypothetical protein